jgi:Sulfotransferase family
MLLPNKKKDFLTKFFICQTLLLVFWQWYLIKQSICQDKRLSGHPSPMAAYTKRRQSRESYMDGVLIRTFRAWSDSLPLPCGRADPVRWSIPEVSRSPTREGILFAKEMKTGSSTVSGITLRIARNLAKRMQQNVMCESRFDHWPAVEMAFINRDIDKSFLFTVIRNPMDRITSQFFHFQVSRKKLEPSDKNFIDYFEQNLYMQDYYLKDLALIPPNDMKLKRLIHFYDPTEIVQEKLHKLRLKLINGIMSGYDFIGISERMDESLVVLMLLLRLKITDIIYLRAKSSGSFDDGAFNNTCIYIVPSFVSPGMKEYFESQEYVKRSEGDWMLYEAAKKSLDMTIEMLGQDTFQLYLRQFKAAQKIVQEKCSQNIKYPCSASGVRAPYRRHHDPATDCLWLDSGCGYKCLDRLEAEIDSMIANGEY